MHVWIIFVRWRGEMEFVVGGEFVVEGEFVVGGEFVVRGEAHRAQRDIE